MITENILQFIPQRYPFVMIDSLLFVDDKTARTNFLITDQNILCEGNEFSEAGLMENIAQTAAVGAGYWEKMENKPISGGYIVAVKNFEVFILPKINDELITEIEVTNHILNITIIKGKTSCNGQLIAQAEMRIFVSTNN